MKKKSHEGMTAQCTLSIIKNSNYNNDDQNNGQYKYFKQHFLGAMCQTTF